MFFTTSRVKRIVLVMSFVASVVLSVFTGAGVHTVHAQAAMPQASSIKIIVGSFDGYVRAFDSNTGSLYWSYNTGQSVAYSPAVASGVVYVPAYDQLYALNASTGSLIWVSRPDPNYGIYPPAVANGKVYFSDEGGYVDALNTSDGSIAWQYYTGDDYNDYTPAVANGVVYIAEDLSSIVALADSTGTLVWSQQYEVSGSPTVANGAVYFGSYDNSLYAITASAGSFLWSYKTGQFVQSTPTVVGGVVYFGSDDRHVYALKATSGSLIWSSPTKGASQTQPTVVGSVVYAGGGKFMYQLKATDGTVIWRHFVGSQIYKAGTVAANSNVFLGTYGGYVYALHSHLGRLAWNYLTSGPILGSPVLA